LDEVVRNLNEALSLHLEGEDLHALGLAEPLHVMVAFEAPLTLTR
jgi:predicted RNase H-like HicB family nuclease